MSVHWRKATNSYEIKIYQGKDPETGKKKYITRSANTTDPERAKALETTLKAAIKSVKVGEDLESWADMLANLAGVDRQIKSLPLSMLKETWAGSDSVKKLADSTFNARRKAINRFLEWMGENWPALAYVHQVTEEIAEDWKEELKKGASGRVVNNTLGHMRGTWKAIKKKAGAVNVWEEVEPAAELPSLGKKDKSFKRRALTKEEFELVLERASEFGEEWTGLILLGAYTGLRKSDVVKLHKDCIEDGVLRTVPGKTQKYDIQVIIPLHERVMEWLEGVDTFQLLPGLAPKKDSGDMQRHLRYIFDVIEDKKYKISYHCLRHTFRTWISAAGASLEQSKRLCGHLKDETSIKYNHEKELLKELISSL